VAGINSIVEDWLHGRDPAEVSPASDAVAGLVLSSPERRFSVAADGQHLASGPRSPPPRSWCKFSTGLGVGGGGHWIVFAKVVARLQPEPMTEDRLPLAEFLAKARTDKAPTA
jgi:hypothetical protein